MLCECDKKLQAKSNFIFLLIDNRGARSKTAKLKNITLEPLPPNTTSIIQSLNIGIIKNLKARYRMKLVNFIKFFMQEGNENSQFDKFEECAHFVNQIHTKQLRQCVITTHCTPSTFK